MHTNLDRIRHFYEQFPARIAQVREHVGRPLTFAEKLLALHASSETFSDPQSQSISCDFLAIHDTAAPIVLLQFASAGKKISSVPTSIHCDHLVTAESNGKNDLKRCQEDNTEMIAFLKSVAVKFGCEFWMPDTGIMQHQLLEHNAFPGALCIGTEPTISFLGCLGLLALEGSGSQALDAMLGFPFVLETPKIIGIKLTGSLNEWASPKDVALKVSELLAGNRAKGNIIEYFGPGLASLSVTGRATICSMAFQTGALTAIFPYDAAAHAFLEATHRSEIALEANRLQLELCADPEVLAAPLEFYGESIEINLSEIRPSVATPQAVDRIYSLDELQQIIHQYSYPEKLALGLIGSSTNSSYEDIKKAAILARQALKHGLRVKAPLLVSPGSEKIVTALRQEGLLKILEDVGATILSSGCGPCSGLWKRQDVAFGERNSILTSFNCNSPGHCDSNPGTYAFISSPEIVMALALAGTLRFNPLTDLLFTAQGLPIRLQVPEKSPLPKEPFECVSNQSVLPQEESALVQIAIDPQSERLQLFDPFKAHQERSFSDLRLLLKVDNKCTTDHICPAGKWARFRGHLDNLSSHLFSLLPNSFRDEVGKGKNLLNNCIEPFAKIARDYKKEGIGWIGVALDNYGEGPLREQAAMAVRHLGGKAIIAKSFAAVHEEVLKKQGVLTLTFSSPIDREKIREDDLMDLLGVSALSPGSTLELLLKHSDGTTDRITLLHSYTEAQLTWFKAGSLLTLVSGG